MARLTLRNVSVTFPIFTSHTRSLRAALFTRLGGRIERHNDTLVVTALSGIDLTLSDGDRLAIVGHNGAGKTTLLRVLAGVYEPTGGAIAIDGRVASFTDITLGMDPEATGRENIIFRLVFLGMTFAEARELSTSIEAFSEAGDYLDVPVRTYSAGMFLRLAFAISTSFHPDIVIMDEMIGAGDQQFVVKAQRRIEEILARSNVLVLASHNLALARALCTKALWLEKGTVRGLGDVDDVIDGYMASLGQ